MPDRRRSDRRPAAAAAGPSSSQGRVAVAVAIAAGEILAGLIAGAPSLVVAVGSLVIDLQPPGAKDVVVSLFGTNDKLALNVLILVVALAIGGLLGLVARSSFGRAAAGFIAFGVVALFASLRLGTFSPPLSVVTVGVAVGAALVTLRTLVDLAAGRQRADARSQTAPTDRSSVPGSSAGATMPDWDRRRFLVTSGSIAVGAVAVGRGRPELLLDSAHGDAAGGDVARLGAHTGAADTRGVVARPGHHPDRRPERQPSTGSTPP